VFNIFAAWPFLVFLAFPLFLFTLAIYFIPTIIAIKEDHPQKAAIIVLNILGGWTFIIWLIALIWALIKPAPAREQSSPTNVMVVQNSHAHAAGNSVTSAIQRNIFNYSTPKLIGVSGRYAGQVVDLSRGQVAIGRDPNVAHLTYPNTNDYISRKHCVIHFDENRQKFILQDTSTNGTYLYPGERLAYGLPVQIESGTRFFIGEPREQYELVLG